MLVRSIAALIVAAPLAACGPRYVYQPAENATAQIRGRAAADYQIPAQAPQGDVRLASFGFSRVSPPNAPPNETERVLHLRMVVANNGAQPWHLDTRQQILNVSGVGNYSPAFVRSPEGIAGLPAVEVAPGAKRTLDLFYRLPAGMNRAGNVSQFDEVWRVDLPGQTVVERTPFDRLRVDPAYAYGYGPYDYYGWGAGPYWYPPDVEWFGPDWLVGPPSWWGW